jgi:hypothetical protein
VDGILKLQFERYERRRLQLGERLHKPREGERRSVEAENIVENVRCIKANIN